MLFDRWRQRVLPWGHIGATWRIPLNLCILRPTRIHNRNGKLIGPAIFAQLTTESAYNLQWVPPIHQNCPFPWGIWTSHATHDALGPCEPTTQKAPRSVQPCLHRWPRSVPILYNGLPVSPQIAPFHVGIWTSLGPPKWQLDRFSRFCRAH